jgi:hypothetical protein
MTKRDLGLETLLEERLQLLTERVLALETLVSKKEATKSKAKSKAKKSNLVEGMGKDEEVIHHWLHDKIEQSVATAIRDSLPGRDAEDIRKDFDDRVLSLKTGSDHKMNVMPDYAQLESAYERIYQGVEKNFKEELATLYTLLKKANASQRNAKMDRRFSELKQNSEHERDRKRTLGIAKLDLTRFNDLKQAQKNRDKKLRKQLKRREDRPPAGNEAAGKTRKEKDALSIARQLARAKADSKAFLQGQNEKYSTGLALLDKTLAETYSEPGAGVSQQLSYMTR